MSPSLEALEALRELCSQGCQAWVEEDNIKLRFEGLSKRDLAKMWPLLGLLKAHKAEVMGYLKTQTLDMPSCNSCPWCVDNPWSLYPDIPKWCGYRWDGLLADNPQCRDRLEGRVPAPRIRQNDHLKCSSPGNLTKDTGVPLTCFNCGHFRPALISPNPAESWGYCQRLGKGRYGVARACDAFCGAKGAKTAPETPKVAG